MDDGTYSFSVEIASGLYIFATDDHEKTNPLDVVDNTWGLAEGTAGTITLAGGVWGQPHAEDALMFATIDYGELETEEEQGTDLDVRPEFADGDYGYGTNDQGTIYVYAWGETDPQNFVTTLDARADAPAGSAGTVRHAGGQWVDFQPQDEGTESEAEEDTGYPTPPSIDLDDDPGFDLSDLEQEIADADPRPWPDEDDEDEGTDTTDASDATDASEDEADEDEADEDPWARWRDPDDRPAELDNYVELGWGSLAQLVRDKQPEVEVTATNRIVIFGPIQDADVADYLQPVAVTARITFERNRTRPNVFTVDRLGSRQKPNGFPTGIVGEADPAGVRALIEAGIRAFTTGEHGDHYPYRDGARVVVEFA